MDGIHAQERRIADPVRYAGVQEPRPEGFVPRRVGGPQPDVAEMRDSGVARRKIAQARMERAHHDLDLVAGRILEGEEMPDAAQLAFVIRPVVHRVPRLFDLGAGLVEVLAVLQVEGDRMIRRVPLEIDQRVVARVAAPRCLVAAEVGGLAFPARELQPDDLGGELDRRFEIRRADTQVTDIVEIDQTYSLTVILSEAKNLLFS